MSSWEGSAIMGKMAAHTQVSIALNSISDLLRRLAKQGNLLRGLSPKGMMKEHGGKCIYLVRPEKEAHHLQDLNTRSECMESHRKAAVPPGSFQIEVHNALNAPQNWRKGLVTFHMGNGVSHCCFSFYPRTSVSYIHSMDRSQEHEGHLLLFSAGLMAFISDHLSFASYHKQVQHHGMHVRQANKTDTCH